METSKREMKVLITGKSENPTKINLRAGKFELAIDEPKSLGGTDQGPSPVQVLLMALAGCLNVTGHEVARQKGLTLHGMKVRIEGVMNPCTFLGCSFEERAG
ncbi:MAG TPA: osmotically inducible protein C, partial [Spirochaetaceae bacterium]|nr:osmotically inducible protein C [Spirochaetaceae bacterium]